MSREQINNTVLIIIIILVSLVVFSFPDPTKKTYISIDKSVAGRIATNAAEAIADGYITKSVKDQKLYIPSQIPSEIPDPYDIGGILAYYRKLPVGKIDRPLPHGPKYHIYYPLQDGSSNFYITCDVENGNVIVKVGKNKATAVETASDNIIMWGNHKAK